MCNIVNITKIGWDRLVIGMETYVFVQNNPLLDLRDECMSGRQLYLFGPGVVAFGWLAQGTKVGGRDRRDRDHVICHLVRTE